MNNYPNPKYTYVLADCGDKVCERLAMYEDADEMMEARPQNASD